MQKIWTWRTGSVNRASEHLELRYGSASDTGWEDWMPLALVGTPLHQVFPVEFLLSPTTDRHHAALAEARRELDFYLVEKSEQDPWAYALYHCGTSANAYSSVHWSHVNGQETAPPLNVEPTIVAKEIADFIKATKPTVRSLREVQHQLSIRHTTLGLSQKLASEEIVESFFRCALLDHLQQRFHIQLDQLSKTINSSHTAARGVCVTKLHRHGAVGDSEWESGWMAMQHRHPLVNVRAEGSQSPKRADLYVITQDKIVSIEFKYIGRLGMLDVKSCAAQMKRYADLHAATLLVVYCGCTDTRTKPKIDMLRDLLGTEIPLICTYGQHVPV